MCVHLYLSKKYLYSRNGFVFLILRVQHLLLFFTNQPSEQLRKGSHWEQYWTSPGSNTPQGTNYTVSYHLSRKLFKLDKPDMLEKQGRARKWCTPVDPCIWPIKSRMTISNIHTAVMWWYYLPTPPLGQWSLTGLNSEFSFS